MADSTADLPQWYIDVTTPSKPKLTNIPDPPGFASTNKRLTSKSSAPSTRKPPSASETDTLKLKKAWELAIAPAKSLPMNAIMMYMSGNSLQIFSIMMVFMLFKNPLQALTQTNSVFAKFESEGTKSKLVGVKIVYVLCNLLALGLGLWKVNGMGLLPNTRSDWLAWEKEREALENTILAIR